MMAQRTQFLQRNRCAARPRRAPLMTQARSLGLTIVELMIAVLISLILLSGVVTAFTLMYTHSEQARRKMEAISNGQAALQAISMDVSAARLDPLQLESSLVGVNIAQLGGDRTDNDGDGLFDEETPNGLDDDSDYLLLSGDRHALIGTESERAQLLGVPDRGDVGVDEDCVFHQDTLTLIKDSMLTPGQLDRVGYYLGSHDGMNNVLMRQIDYDIRTSAPLFLDPLGFDILSINFLYWDANRLNPRDPTQTGPQWPPYWVEEWDTLTIISKPPSIPLPIAVQVEVVVYAGSKPYEMLGPNERIETVKLSTVVVIEQAIHDPRYEIVRDHF